MDNASVDNIIPTVNPVAPTILSPKPPSPLTPIMAVVTLLAISASVFFYYQNTKLQDQLSKIQATILIPTPTAGIDSTANWKTYKNSALGFELKYPPSVQVDKELNDQYNRLTFFKGDGLIFQVSIQKNVSNISLANYKYLDFPVKQKTTLGGNPANIYEMPIGYCDGPSCSDPSITIVTEYGPDFYHLEYYGDTQLSDVENQILSTFKFVEKNSDAVDMSTWKTYIMTLDTSPEYTLKYPNTVVVKTGDAAEQLSLTNSRDSLSIVLGYPMTHGGSLLNLVNSERDKYIKDKWRVGDVEKISAINSEGYKFLSTYSDGSCDNYYFGSQTQQSKYVLIRKCLSIPPNTEFDSIGSQILSTFQFTN